MDRKKVYKPAESAESAAGIRLAGHAGQLISLFLTLTMLLSLFTVSAFAVGPGPDASGARSEPLGVPVKNVLASAAETTPTTSWIICFVVKDNIGGSVTAVADGVPITTGTSVNDGVTVVFTAKPDANYKVKDWTLEGASQQSDAKTFSHQPVCDMNVAVEFEEITEAAAHALSVYTPIYLSEQYIYGMGEPGADIEVIREGGFKPTTAKVGANGLWVAKMPVESSVEAVDGPLVKVSAPGGGEEEVKITISQTIEGEPYGELLIAMDDIEDESVGAPRRYIIWRMIDSDTPIDGFVQDHSFHFTREYPAFFTVEETGDLYIEVEDIANRFEEFDVMFDGAIVPNVTLLYVYYVQVNEEEIPVAKISLLTVDYNFGGHIDEKISKIAGHAIEADAFAYGPYEGHEFYFWSVETEADMPARSEKNPFEFVMPEDDVVLTAHWLEFADEVGPGDGGTGNPGTGVGPGGGGGGSSATVTVAQTDKPEAAEETEDEEEAGDGATEAVTLPAKILPRYTQGLENNFIPLAAFTPEHIAYLYGYAEGGVKPDENISRSQAAALIFRILSDKNKNDEVSNPFEFADWEWYRQEVSYLAKQGVVKGYEDGTFRPDKPVTRGEFIAMICRFDDSFGPYEAVFGDVAGHWAKGYIEIGASNGWISGYEDGTFKPDAYITRAEVVSVINRLLYRGIEKSDIPEWAPVYNDLSASHWAYADIMEASVGHEFERKANGYELWTGRLN